MDRATFCKMLVVAREKSRKTIPQISFGIQMLTSGLYRMEKGTYNSRMDNIIRYLKFIGYHIQLTKEFEYKDEVEIIEFHKYEDIVMWFKELRGDTPRNVFAAKIGMNRSCPRIVEVQQNVLSIDWILKIAEVFGYSVALAKNG